jgi:hypothetical protein
VVQAAARVTRSQPGIIDERVAVAQPVKVRSSVATARVLIT